MSEADDQLVEAHRAIIQDPFDPQVIAAAKANGISDAMINAAQHSPVYKFVKKWKLALPLHPEFRTLPMLFYVPPMLPVLAKLREGHYEISGVGDQGLAPMLSSLERARMPLRYMAHLFSGGNEEIVAAVYRKLIAVRIAKRAQHVSEATPDEVQQAMTVGNTNPEEIEAIFQLTSKPTFEERFVIPPLAREMAVEATLDPFTHKPETGFGFRRAPKRGG